MIQNEKNKKINSLISDKPEKQPDTSKPVFSNEEFDLVYKNKLNNHTILYGAEVDGIDSPVPVFLKSELDQDKLKSRKFIELKTSLEPLNNRQNRNFKKFVYAWDLQ